DLLEQVGVGVVDVLAAPAERVGADRGAAGPVVLGRGDPAERVGPLDHLTVGVVRVDQRLAAGRVRAGHLGQAVRVVVRELGGVAVGVDLRGRPVDRVVGGLADVAERVGHRLGVAGPVVRVLGGEVVRVGAGGVAARLGDRG